MGVDQPDLHLGGPGMLDDVVERLLENAEKLGLHRFRQPAVAESMA